MSGSWALLEALKDNHFWVRWHAVAALGRLEVTDEQVLGSLLEALKDKDSWVRERAAEALGRLGGASERVLRAILEALKDEDPWVRERAAAALGWLGVADERVLRALLEALKDTWVRDAAFGALWDFSERAGVWVGRDGAIRMPGDERAQA